MFSKHTGLDSPRIRAAIPLPSLVQSSPSFFKGVPCVKKNNKKIKWRKIIETLKNPKAKTKQNNNNNNKTNHCTGIFHFIAVYFIALHRYCISYKLKTRPPPAKISTWFILVLGLLGWSRTKPISPRYPCIIMNKRNQLGRSLKTWIPDPILT